MHIHVWLARYARLHSICIVPRMEMWSWCTRQLSAAYCCQNHAVQTRLCARQVTVTYFGSRQRKRRTNGNEAPRQGSMANQYCHFGVWERVEKKMSAYQQNVSYLLVGRRLFAFVCVCGRGNGEDGVVILFLFSIFATFFSPHFPQLT